MYWLILVPSLFIFFSSSIFLCNITFLKINSFTPFYFINETNDTYTKNNPNLAGKLVIW